MNTLIGGLLLLVVLAGHESVPLLERLRDVYRTIMRKRFSSTVHKENTKDISDDKIDQFHVSKEEDGGNELKAKTDSFQLNEITNES